MNSVQIVEFRLVFKSSGFGDEAIQSRGDSYHNSYFLGIVFGASNFLDEPYSAYFGDAKMQGM